MDELGEIGIELQDGAQRCRHRSNWRASAYYDWDPTKVKSRRLLKNSLSFFLAFMGADMFAEYRLTAKNLFKNQNALVLGPLGERVRRHSISPLERWRPKISRMVMCLMLYLVIKISLITILLPRLLKFSNCEQTSSKHDDSYDSLVSWLVCKLEPMAISAPITNANKMFGIGLLLLVFISVRYTNSLQEKSPHYLNAIRFVVDPKHELQRVDANIRHLLTGLQESMVTFAAEMLHISRSRVKYVGNQDADIDCIGFMLQMLEDDWRQIEILEQHQVASLRPSAFHGPSYAVMRHLVGLILPITAIYHNLLGLGFVGSIVWQSRSRCKQLGQHLCSLGPPDYQLAAEFFVGAQCAMQAVTGLIIMLANCLLLHLSLIDGARNELRFCLNQMQQIEASHLFACRRSQTQHASTSRPEDSPLFKARIETNRQMFLSMIKLRVGSLELSSNSETLRIVVEVFLIIMIALITGGLTLEFITDREGRSCRLMILVPCWLLGNAAAATCAYCQARALELESLQWSIVARSVANFSTLDEDKQIWRPTAGMGFASVVWRRYLHSADYWRSTYVPKPGGLLVSYHTILEVNFFIISIITLLVAR